MSFSSQKTSKCVPGILFAILIVCLLLPTTLIAQEQQKQRLTWDNIFTSGLFRAYPARFMWLPDGSGFLYSFQGGLWRYNIESAEKEKLTTFAEITSALMESRETEREEIDNVDASGRFDRSAISLSPDGATITGFHDNDIFIYEIETGEARFITNDPEPEIMQTFSPDSSKVAYIKNHDIYVYDLEGAEQKRLTDNGGEEEVWNGIADWVYEEELSVHRAFWWSPDSSKIAYLQFDTRPVSYFLIIDHLELHPTPEKQKFPLAGESNSLVRLGVLAVEDGKTVWVDTGKDTDIYLPRVKWTRSGQEVTYLWMNRLQDRLELRFADPDSGESRTAVVEESDSWVNISGTWPEPSTDLVFFEDGTYLWISERTGFRHIYHYGKEDNLLRQVTSGEWQVDGIDGISADEKTVYFTATEKSPIERHLYSVGLNGTGFQRITQEDGVHDCWLSPDSEHFVRRYSSARVPPQVSVFKVDGSLVDVIDDGKIPNLEKWRISYPEFLTLESEDGDTLHAMMIKPPEFDPDRRYPVIVYVYGGPGIQMVGNIWRGFFFYMQTIFASRDYIVFTLDNRGSWGRGLAFESKVHRNLGHYELKDQVAGVEYLKTLPYVDSENIGIIGGSYGGYMTLMALFRAPEHFKAGVAGSPGVNWKHYDTIYTEKYMGTPQDNPEGYENSSPAKYAAGLKGHLYLTHGLMDNNAHVQMTIELIDHLLRAGKDFKLMLYPGERHGIRTPYRMMHSNRTTLEFFDTHLKK